MKAAVELKNDTWMIACGCTLDSAATAVVELAQLEREAGAVLARIEAVHEQLGAGCNAA
jgi:hypothetical protein